MLVLTALACAAALRIGFVGTLLAAYLVASAEVVLIPELLNPLSAINPSSYLICEASLAAAAVIAWRRRTQTRSGRVAQSFPFSPRQQRGLAALLTAALRKRTLRPPIQNPGEVRSTSPGN